MYTPFPCVCPHVGHREGCGGTGGNGLPGRLEGARGADLGQCGRRRKENEQVGVSESGSCFNIEAFYGLIDHILYLDLSMKYENEPFKRFKEIVKEKEFEVVFKTGTIVNV